MTSGEWGLGFGFVCEHVCVCVCCGAAREGKRVMSAAANLVVDHELVDASLPDVNVSLDLKHEHLRFVNHLPFKAARAAGRRGRGGAQ